MNPLTFATLNRYSLALLEASARRPEAANQNDPPCPIDTKVARLVQAIASLAPNQRSTIY